jgi:hypothetical protein
MYCVQAVGWMVRESRFSEYSLAERGFSLLFMALQTSSGVHPSFYLVDSKSTFFKIKAAGA